MIKNRKATYEYFIIEKEVAGIILMGSEMKPLRENHASIAESYIYIDKLTEEVFIKNMYIKNTNNNAYSHDEYRERKLLMTKKQIRKWLKVMETQKLTIMPLKAFFDNNNRFKVELFLAKGKKLYDKRQDIKAKDQQKQVDKELKNI